MAPRAVPAPARFAWSLVLALVLALRLATPAGFMPTFERGHVAVVPCDGFAQPPAHMADHGKRHGKTEHQPCPYAAGASPVLLPAGELVAVEPLGATTSAVAQLSATVVEWMRNGRPPATGPPPSQPNIAR